MKNALIIGIFLVLLAAPVFAQEVAEQIAEPGAGDIAPYRPRTRYFSISIRDKFILGEKVEAQVCGSGLATLEIYRFEDLSFLLNRYQYYGDKAEEFLKDQQPFKTITVQPGGECEAVDLQIEQAGLFFIMGYSSEDDRTRTATFSVEGIAMMAKESPNKLIVYVTDINSGRPVANAEIIQYEQKRAANRDELPEITEKTLGFTNDLGLLEWVKEEPEEDAYGQKLLIAKKQGMFSFVQSYYWRSGEDQDMLYLFTDRPIYRPDQSVHFKAVLWKVGMDRYSLEGEQISIVIRDTKYNEVFKESYTTNDFGSFEGEFILTDEPPLGRYSIRAMKGEKQIGYTTFQVEEYRKPEYTVTVNPSKDVFIGGETARVEIEAEYLFKSPVQDAEVMYKVYSSYYRRSCWGYWKCVYYEPLAEYYPGYWPPYYNYGQKLVASGEAVTDAEGKAYIEFDTNADREKRYVIEAVVVDASNRQVSGAGSVIVAPALFRLTVMPEKWWYGEEEDIVLNIEAQDFEAVPVDTEATVRIYGLQWNSETKEYDEELVHEEIAATSEGEAEITARLPAGQYKAKAEALDAQGNKAESENSFSVRGKAQKRRYQEMEASLDRELYLPGEDAVLTIAAPEADYYALISVEGRGIFGYEVIHSLGQEFSYIIPVNADYEPNAFVTVTGVQNGKVFIKTLSINVPPKESKIDIEIETDRDYYYPRETAHYKVKATANGVPVAAEFAVMLVDEAIFQLAEDNKQDIFQFFFRPEYNRVSTQWSLRDYYYPYYYYDTMAAGGMMEESRAMDAGIPMATPAPMADGGGKKAYVTAEVRKKFADTAYWKAFLKTDADGIAEFNIELPDNLTTWRAAVIANSQTKAGMQEDKIASTKDVIARLIVPKFTVKGDEFIVTAIAHNNLAEMKDALVRIESDNIEFLDSNQEEITIASGRSEKIEFKARAIKCCSAVVKLEVLTDVESDALEIVMPVLPWGVKEYETVSGVTEGSVEIGVEIPEDTEREADKIIIGLSPTLAASIVDSLDYLTGYPYGCVEQTMSRFLPDVVVANTLKELGVENSELEKELPEMVDKGLQKLYGFQLGDGGWGWWRNDESQPFMTAYVLYGLTLAEEAGFEVNDEVMERGKNAAVKLFDSTDDREVQAFISYALYLNGNSKFVEELKTHSDAMSDYGLALLILQLESKEDAQPYLDELLENAECDAVFCSWKGKSWRGYWSERDMESTAMALKALVKFDPERDEVRKSVTYLMSKKEYNRWRSTQDTATAVMALTDYLKYSGELDPDFTARVYVNDVLEKEFSVTKANLFEIDPSFTVTEPEKSSTVRIEVEGRGKLYYSVTKEYFLKQEEIEQKDNGIRVSRTVKNEIDIGEEVTVTLKVEAAGDYDYIIIEDYLPAGISVVDTRKRSSYGYYWASWRPYWYSRRETRDERVVFFFNRLREGEITLEYKVRGEVTGKFKHLPAQAYLMYNPEINGHSSGGKFTVTGEKSFSFPKLEIRDDYIWIYPRPIPAGASVSASIVDSEGNEVAGATATVEEGKAAIPLSGALADGRYSVKATVVTEGETVTTTKDFQVGTVEVMRSELADAGHSNELVERTAQGPIANPVEGLCASAGGTWTGGKCTCPAGSYWVLGAGCEEPAPDIVIPLPLELDLTAYLIIAVVLGAIVLVFVVFLKKK